MNKTQNWLIVLSAAAALALSACGVSEPDDGFGSGDATGDTDGNAGNNSGAAIGDAGAPSTDGTGTTGTGGADSGTDTPASDAGSAPPADGGSGGDAGAPSTDAGTSPTPDAGSPTPDAGSTPPDAGTPAPVSPGPLASPSACQLRFADMYIDGNSCGQIRGNLPGATWSSGPSMSDRDGDHLLESSFASIAAGTYELTYVSATCPGGAAVTETWATYGTRSQLLAMSADSRSFVNCNWWDAASGTTVSVASPGCNLRITVDAACNVTGAGNMRNYN